MRLIQAVDLILFYCFDYIIARTSPSMGSNDAYAHLFGSQGCAEFPTLGGSHAASSTSLQNNLPIFGGIVAPPGLQPVDEDPEAKRRRVENEYHLAIEAANAARAAAEAAFTNLHGLGESIGNQVGTALAEQGETNMSSFDLLINRAFGSKLPAETFKVIKSLADVLGARAKALANNDELAKQLSE